jgi:hypothetical protein
MKSAARISCGGGDGFTSTTTTRKTIKSMIECKAISVLSGQLLLAAQSR